MNLSISYFAGYKDIVTQFPDRLDEQLCKSWAKQLNASNMIVVHRDDDLMYYISLNKLDDEGHYFGIVILINGILITDYKALSQIFKKALAAISGNILKICRENEQMLNGVDISAKQSELDKVSNIIRSGMETITSFKKLPPINYGRSVGMSRCFSETELSTSPEFINEIPQCTTAFIACDFFPLIDKKQNVTKQEAGNKVSKSLKNAVRIIIGLVILWFFGIGYWTVKDAWESSKEAEAVYSDSIETTYVDEEPLAPIRSEAKTASTTSVNYQEELSGVVGDKYPIRMSLKFLATSSNQEIVKGSYYYQKNGSAQAITISGRYDTATKRIVLNEYYDNGQKNCSFIGVKNKNGYTGKFIYPNGEKINFELYLRLIINEKQNR